MPMRFGEWEKALEQQWERHKKISLQNIEESISFDNHQIRVVIGKTDYTAFVDGSSGSPSRMLKSLYTERKEEFEALLDSITEQTDTVIEASITMFNLATADQIPGAVLERIKGEQVTDDPIEMVEKTCEARFQELLKILERRWPVGILQQLSFVTPVAGKDLTVAIEEDHQRIEWGEINADRNYKKYSQDLEDAETAMLFTLKYEAIKDRLLHIIRQIACVD